MNRSEYEVVWTRLTAWMDKAYGPQGCTFVTVAAVAKNVTQVCTSRPESIISGVPNRVPGTSIYWTATVDHQRKHITVIAIEPEPRPGL